MNSNLSLEKHFVMAHPYKLLASSYTIHSDNLFLSEDSIHSLLALSLRYVRNTISHNFLIKLIHVNI